MIASRQLEFMYRDEVKEALLKRHAHQYEKHKKQHLDVAVSHEYNLLYKLCFLIHHFIIFLVSFCKHLMTYDILFFINFNIQGNEHSHSSSFLSTVRSLADIGKNFSHGKNLQGHDKSEASGLDERKSIFGYHFSIFSSSFKSASRKTVDLVRWLYRLRYKAPVSGIFRTCVILANVRTVDVTISSAKQHA